MALREDREDPVTQRLGGRDDEQAAEPGQLGQVVARAISQRLVAALSFERVFKSLGDRVKGLFGR